MIHYTPSYLVSPTHPVTIDLVGCGGTGSQVLTKLALLHITLQELGHAGLYVRVFDPDKIEAPNLGRQLFYEPDVGHHKATVLLSRVNRAFGLDWKSFPYSYSKKNVENPLVNILITCVDSAKTRIEIGEWIKEEVQQRNRRNNAPYNNPYYWLDYGNSKNTGQVVLGTWENIEQPLSKKQTADFLPNVLDLFPEMKGMDDTNLPSCSTYEALTKQDLFTNCMLAPFGTQLLWQLLREAKIEHHGAFLNMHSLKSNPIKIKSNKQ